jgi:DNA-binding transcriptional MerR regulator
MTTLRIAEVAEQTGVPATTLRYYEDIGLLAAAGRSANGYRAYSQRDVERLRFITRAKQLDLSLDDLRELLQAWDSDDCAGVQDRMSQVVSARLAQTQQRITDLMELAGQLQTAADRLTQAPQAGPCDPGCACTTAPPAPAASGGGHRSAPVPVRLLTSAAAGPRHPVTPTSAPSPG